MKAINCKQCREKIAKEAEEAYLKRLFKRFGGEFRNLYYGCGNSGNAPPGTFKEVYSGVL